MFHESAIALCLGALYAASYSPGAGRILYGVCVQVLTVVTGYLLLPQLEVEVEATLRHGENVITMVDVSQLQGVTLRAMFLLFTLRPIAIS
jgi:hypothetical protein